MILTHVDIRAAKGRSSKSKGWTDDCVQTKSSPFIRQLLPGSLQKPPRVIVERFCVVLASLIIPSFAKGMEMWHR